MRIRRRSAVMIRARVAQFAVMAAAVLRLRAKTRRDGRSERCGQNVLRAHPGLGVIGAGGLIACGSLQ